MRVTWKPRAEDVVAESPSGCDFAARLSAGRLSLAAAAVDQGCTRRAPGRRHGPRQDAADPGLSRLAPAASAGAQAIAPRPILTVAPTGLLKNWLAEHDKHLKEPGLGEILQVHGQGLADLRTGPRTAPELQGGRADARHGADASGGLGADHLRDASRLSTQLRGDQLGRPGARRGAEDQESSGAADGRGQGDQRGLHRRSHRHAGRESTG